MRNLIVLIASTAALASAGPAFAQRTGVGGTGVDERSTIPTCIAPLGTVALVEQTGPAAGEPEIPPGLAALVRMAEAQNGGSTARVDPIPLIRLLAARSGCFRVVDRGQGFQALERERAIAGQSTPAMVAADYLINAQVIYSDGRTRTSGGGLGSLRGAMGLSQRTLESQIMLTLTDVRTGVQEAVATGSARKKDLSVIGGGLIGAGIGALGGSYASTDIGKITSLAMLEAFRALVTDAQARLRPATPPAAPTTTPQPAAVAAPQQRR